MEPVRVGVVGVGALGHHHARVYASLPGARLTAVADVLPDRVQNMAASVGAEPFTDYRDFLGRVDAVSVAAPTTLHGVIGRFFLDAGIHVLVEKPMAHSLAEADSLIETARRAGRVLQVGHVERFNPGVRELQQMVRHPRFFEAHRMGLFSPRSLDIDVILDLMIHDLDIIQLLVPSPPVHISAVGLPILSHRIDIANARIEFADGCVANVTASRVSTEKIRKLRLFQAREYISLDYTRQDVSVFALQGLPGEPNSQIRTRKLEPARRQPLEEELRSFLAAVRGDGPLECSGEDGRRALDLALMILAKARQALERESEGQ